MSALFIWLLDGGVERTTFVPGHPSSWKGENQVSFCPPGSSYFCLPGAELFQPPSRMGVTQHSFPLGFTSTSSVKFRKRNISSILSSLPSFYHQTGGRKITGKPTSSRSALGCCDRCLKMWIIHFRDQI